MGIYKTSILSLKRDLQDKERLLNRLSDRRAEVKEKEEEYNNLVDASKLIATVADKQSMDTLDYITSVISKTLGELFKSDTRRIYLKKQMHAGRYAHLKVLLTDAEGVEYDMLLQSGTGLRQVISFLFCLCLIQISGGRKVFIQDELLGGTHGAAKEVLKQIIRISAKDFQFIMIEYGFDDIGKIYNVEKPGKTSYVYDLDGEDYDARSVYIFSNAEGNVDLKEVEEA